MEDNELQILISVALDLTRSLQNVQQGLTQLQAKLKNETIQLKAGLNKTESVRQLKNDLRAIDLSGSSVKVRGRLDREATQREIASAVSKLDESEARIVGVLDTMRTVENIKSQLGQIPSVEATAGVNVDGAQEVDNLTERLNRAGTAADGMAMKVNLAHEALSLLKKTAREAAETVAELDTAATSLALATGDGTSNAYDLLGQYNDLAQEVGATTMQVSDAADQWLRQGKTAAETTELIQQAMVLSKVGQMSSEAATRNLTSALRGYKLEADAAAGIVDRLTAVDLKAAVSSDDLSISMARTAASANMAGVDMDRLIGYITAIEETTQKSAETVGESLKTMFARVQNIKIGKFIDDETGESLNDTEKILHEFGIELRNTAGDFRSVTDVLDELNTRWGNLTSLEKSAIAVAAAGTRQRENFIVLLDNYSRALEMSAVAADSAGTAMQKFQAYEDSLEAKTNSLKAALEGLVLDNVDTGLAKDLVDATTAMVNFIDKTGLLKATLLSLTAAGLFKGFDFLVSKIGVATQTVKNFGTALNILRKTEDTTALTGTALKNLGNLVKGLDDGQLKLLLSTKALSTAQMKQILTASGLSSAEAKAKLETLGLAGAQGTATGTTLGLAGAFKELALAMAANPLTWVTAGIALLTGLVQAYQAYEQAQEEARQATIDAGNAYQDTADSIDDYADKIAELKDSLDSGNLSEQEAYQARLDLLSIQDRLMDLYGGEIEQLDLLTTSADEAARALSGVTVAMANENLNKYATTIKDAITAMEEANTYAISGVVLNDSTIEQQIKDIVAKYQDATLEVIPGNSVSKYNSMITVTADAEDAKETLNSLATDFRTLREELRKEGVELDKDTASFLDGVADQFSTQLARVDSIFADYEQIYDDYVRWTIAASPEYSDVANQVIAAKNAFQKALAADDLDAQETALNLIDSLSTALEGTDFTDDPGVKAYLENLIAAIEDESSKARVKLQLMADIENDTGSITNVLGTIQAFADKEGNIIQERIGNYRLLSESADDLSGFSEEEQAAYAALETAASGYGVTVEDLISLLADLGAIKLPTVETGGIEDVNQLKTALFSLNDEVNVLQDAMGQLKTGNLDNWLTSDENANLEALLKAYPQLRDELEAYSSGLKTATSLQKTFNSVLVSDSLTLAEKSISTLKAAFDELNKDGAITYTTLGKIADEFSDVSGIDGYIKKLAALKSGSHETGQVMEEMIAALIQARFASVDLADADENLIAAMLEEAGVANAAEHAHWLITDAKAKNILATYDLTNATEDSLTALLNEIQGLLGEGDAAQWAEKYVAALRMEQILCNQNSLDSTDSVNSLIAIAAAAGASTTALSRLATAKEAIASGTAAGFHMIDQMDSIKADAEKEARDIVSSLKNSVSAAFTGTSTYKFKPSSSSKSSSTSKSGKDVEKYEAELDALYEKLQAIQRIKDDIERENAKADLLDGNDFDAQIEHHKLLIQMYEKEQTALHALAESRRELISANLQTLSARGIEYDYDAANNTILIRNMERINELSATTKGKYDTLQEATNVLRKETEELIGTTIDMVEANRENSDSWWELQSSIKSARSDIVDTLIAMADAANDAVDSIQNVESVLSDAAQEFADNDGWISIDTFQAIRDLGTEYMQMLINENNELVINRERINGIIEAKTRQLAVEQALSYVERLRLAATGASNESLDQLCFATTQATNSTWGLVYAELALMQQTGLLNGSQYQAALHNIQAIQSLAETAVAGIGQTAGAAAEKMDKLKEQLEDQKDALEDLLDELEDMKDGCDDLVKYVMDMLKDRIQQQIDALNDAKKAVKDYVDQLKEAMRAEKENVEYEDELADKLKAIAKLQSKIDALSLDDSRKAQAEKMALEEELAELQKDLADFQADHAMDVTEDALDKQYEAYEQEKDAEIEKLEESISSTQKLYDMAIKYIKENWSTLYQELLDWNYEYGNSLNSEITAAWEAAQEAASRYGDFVTAIMGGIESDIAKITAQIQSLTTQISNLSNSTSGASGNGIGGSMPNVVGTVNTDTSYSDEDMKQAKRKAVSDVVNQMRALSAQWHTADKATQKRLEDQALQMGATLASYGVVAHRDEPTGAWYIDNDLLNPSNVGKLLYSCYHTGGFVGEKPLKPNERYVKAENGELILTSDQQDSFAAQVDSFKAMADAFSRSVMAMPVNTDSLWPKGFAEGSSSTSNVSTDNSRTITVNEGDIYISVPSPDGKTIADEVRNITRDNLNQISRYLRRP